ncbi:MAG TPA: methionyl-tRNA formyltransferase [Candidatus Binataceae bacterium]|nr:methionyl-tRNA formyltransferase [Candidatus Binataceae bacterium]
MRIALLGQAAFAQQALEALVKHGDQIVHVFAPPDPPGGRPDPLKAKALELGLPLSQPASMRSDAAYEHFKSLDADLAILAFVTIIVPERVLYAPRHKSICYHPSLLPRHRGASAINWAIIHGDTETGITWFWPDKGIDTGPILLQRRVPIGANDTTGSLYFNTLFPLGIETMIEAVDLIKSGRAPSIPQDERLATYEPPCRDEHGKIDFARSAREVHNLVRGCDPQPGAYAALDARRVRLYDAVLDAPSAPEADAGTVGAIDDRGMRIALKGGTLVARRARIEPSPKKVAPAELAASGEIKPGARLQ